MTACYARQTPPYQKLLLFGMILPSSALLPVLVLLMQQVLLVASPAHQSIVSQNYSITSVLAEFVEEHTERRHITMTDSGCQLVDDKQGTSDLP